MPLDIRNRRKGATVGSFGGALMMRSSLMLAITLVLSMPSRTLWAGVKPGDVITSIDNKPIAGRAGARIPLQSWGYVVTGPNELRIATGWVAISGLTIRLTQPHAGLPGGTTVLVTLAGLPAREHAGPRAAKTPKTEVRSAARRNKRRAGRARDRHPPPDP